MIPIELFIPRENRTNDVILWLNEQGMKLAADQKSLLKLILQQGHSVLLFDVPGIGSLGPGYLKGDAYIDNTSYNQWFAGILTDKSVVGIRVEDIMRISHFIRAEIDGIKSISGLAYGAMGSEMLHAALFDKNIQRVCLVRPFVSFAGIALSRDYLPKNIPSTIAGAIQDYDLADILAALCPRKVLIIDPNTGSSSSTDQKTVSEYLVFPKKVYANNGFDKNFESHFLKGVQTHDQLVIEWLK